MVLFEFAEFVEGKKAANDRRFGGKALQGRPFVAEGIAELRTFSAACFLQNACLR